MPSTQPTTARLRVGCSAMQEMQSRDLPMIRTGDWLPDAGSEEYSKRLLWWCTNNKQAAGDICIRRTSAMDRVSRRLSCSGTMPRTPFGTAAVVVDKVKCCCDEAVGREPE